MTHGLSTPINPKPMKKVHGGSLPAYLSNGLVGLRVRDMPLRSGTAILGGYSGRDPEAQVDAAQYAPYPLAGDLCIGQTWLSSDYTLAHFEEQAYDFSCGELRTNFVFAADGVRLEVEVLTFCSRTLPTLVVQEMIVTPDNDCDLSLRAGVDPTGIPGRWLARTVGTPSTAAHAIDGSLHWESLGALSTCGVAYVTRLVGAGKVQPSYDEWHEERPLATAYTFHAHSGRTYRLQHITSMVPSELHHSPDQQAARLAWLGADTGFEQLRKDNRAAWADLWRGRVCLQGAPSQWQALADAAFFYLHTSVHPSSPASIAPFGLASWHNYHYYYGHIMWDLEAFTMPPLFLTYPPAARAMLDYRVRHLDAAAANARLFGYRGLQFPWQSSPTHGEECTPLSSPASIYEQHASLDVAFAFAQFADVTKDDTFCREQAWPVLRGVAEWIESRVVATKRGYEILHTTGPAEERGPVDNDAYVNMAAIVTLRAALAFAQRFNHPVPTAWEHIAQKLVIPQDADTGVIQNYDGYSPDQPGGGTPSAAAGFYPLSYRTDSEVERATLRYYLDLAPKYIGAPMLSAMYGVYAAWLGDRARSLAMFEQGYAAFEEQPFNVPGETPDSLPPRAGPFFANLGGFLMACLFGLPGITLGPGEPETWCERPVTLPIKWDAIEVDRIWVRGSPARLTAHHGDDHASLTLCEE